ncbi:hypothetical protein [Agathobaculum sp.]|jgi:hypothetical protein|uniref:hypothetical protein n=1 Tax=Agathobaculum sp. TaxID=2048138 RepID=UPI003D9159EE
MLAPLNIDIAGLVAGYAAAQRYAHGSLSRLYHISAGNARYALVKEKTASDYSEAVKAGVKQGIWQTSLLT